MHAFVDRLARHRPAHAIGHRRRLGAGAAAGTIAALVLLVPGAAVASPGPDAGIAAFTAPTRIFTGDYFDFSFALDSHGKVRGVARGNSGLWYITNASGSWVRTRLTTHPAGGADYQQSVALDAQDHVFVAFTRTDCAGCAPGGSTGIFLLTNRGRTDGSFPANPTRLTPAEFSQPSLQIDHGHIELAYAAFPLPGPGPFPVWFKTNATGAWTTRKVASNGEEPSLRVGSDRHARIAWDWNGGIRLATATTLAGNFTSGPVTSAGHDDQSAVLSLDTLNRPHIAFTRMSGPTSGTHHVHRSGGTWLGSRVSPSISGADLALNPAGKPRLAVVTDSFRIAYYHVTGAGFVHTTVGPAADALLARIAVDRLGRATIIWTQPSLPNGIYLTQQF